MAIVKTLPESGLGLAHNRNHTASREKYDPIWMTQFIVLFDLPPAVLDYLDGNYTLLDYKKLLMEHCLEVKGFPQTTPGKAVITKHQFAEAGYGNGAPERTSFELEMKFSVFEDYNRAMYIYNVLRAWANLIYDPSNGSQGLKWEYAGGITVALGGKDRVAFKNWIIPTAFITEEFNEPELDYNKGEETYQITAKFHCDYADELIVGMTGRYNFPNQLPPQNATIRDTSVRDLVPGR